MTTREAKRLRAGDTFRATLRNGSSRRYEVVSVDLCDITVMDEYRYTTRFPFTSPSFKTFFSNAEPLKVQQ